MINGIYLDPRSWKVDCLPYPNWHPEEHGVRIRLFDETEQQAKKHPGKDCKFAICTEVWTPQMQETLTWLKNLGLKIFMLPREMLLAEGYRKVMFEYKQCEYKGRFFFNPDVVLSPSPHYSGFWCDKTKVIETGHPKFDQYALIGWHDDKNEIYKRYNLDPSKKTVLFSSYWNKHYQNYESGVKYVDIAQDHLRTMQCLEKAALDSDKIQVVVKIHPTTQKLYLKGKEKLDPIMEKYYNTQSGPIRVVKDDRLSSKISKNLLYISDLIVGFKSTMMLEALAINKTVLNVMFDQAKALTGLPDIVTRLFTVKEPDELYRIIAGADYDFRSEQDQQVKFDYMYHVDGLFCDRMCKTIISEMKI